MRNINSACGLHIKNEYQQFHSGVSWSHTDEEKCLDTSSHVYNNLDRHNECRPTNAMHTYTFNNHLSTFIYIPLCSSTKA